MTEIGIAWDCFCEWGMLINLALICFHIYYGANIYWQSMYRTDSRFAPSQWETALLCNDVSHWLVANLKSALMYSCFRFISYITHIMYICIRPNLKQGEQTRPHETIWNTVDIGIGYCPNLRLICIGWECQSCSAWLFQNDKGATFTP